jgi:hypothetical protein
VEATTAPVTYTGGCDVRSIAVGDITGDGVDDLVFANDGDGALGVSENLGDGRFAPQVSWALTGDPVSVALADLNGDGQLDIAVAVTSTWGNNAVDVLLSVCK